MIDQMSAFLQKLRKSTAGNTLAIAAAALVPLVGMVGGAVDISRYYMATARMQNACDAGALAARKQMDSDAFEEADRQQGLRFFDQNYPDGTFGLENLDRDYTADADGTVTGTATGDMPTTIMQIFGKTGMDIAVSCSAEINISNTDIMFVLDTTGSMAWRPDGSSTCGTCSDSRIAGLRTAVVNFFDAVDAATSDAAQVRYGIMPYSTNVNVGALIPSQYIATEAKYQTRYANTHTETWWEMVNSTVNGFSNQGSVDYDQDVYWGWRKTSRESHCQRQQPTAVPLSYVPGSLQEDTIEIVSETQDGNLRIREITGRGMLRQIVPSYEYPGNNWCRTYSNIYESWADIDITIYEELRSDEVLDSWSFALRPLDTTGFKNNGVGSSVTWDTSWNNYTDSRDEPHTWNGCIEEAGTVNQTTWDPIPANAFDLDINLKPANNTQAWKPFVPTAVWQRKTRWGGIYFDEFDIPANDSDWFNRQTKAASLGLGVACPKQALKLGEITRSQLVSYVSAATGFVPNGYTYHDIGMIWGARFISPRGIFQSENESAPNGDSIARHIVFMTDGQLDTEPDRVYNAYGIEYWDRRVTSDGQESTADANTAARFQAACRQAREENIAVWVVAFGTTLTQNLIDCATPGRAYSAASSEQLNNAFQEIAQKIAALRLTS